jgi:hypothetical protein
MAEPQPKTVHEGATSGDVEDEVTATAKSAEDRKAAAALASLDARGDDAGNSSAVDQDAANKAIKSLGGAAPAADKKEVKKVKVDAADVALLVSRVFRSWEIKQGQSADEVLTTG